MRCRGLSSAGLVSTLCSSVKSSRVSHGTLTWSPVLVISDPAPAAATNARPDDRIRAATGDGTNVSDSGQTAPTRTDLDYCLGDVAREIRHLRIPLPDIPYGFVTQRHGGYKYWGDLTLIWPSLRARTAASELDLWRTALPEL